MIYDCFSFFNELDILEIRLNELYDVVDHFVLVEATKTHQGQPKPLYYADNKETFQPFNDKIIHVIVDKYPTFFSKFRVPTGMDFDNSQRHQMVQGLKNCQPNDWVIVSDLDEIPSAEHLSEAAKLNGTQVFAQYYSNYFANYVATNGVDGLHYHEVPGYFLHKGSVMVRYSKFTNPKKTRLLRDLEAPEVNVIEKGGWHLSFLGGLEQIKKKLKAWCHANESHYSPEYLESDENILKIIDSGDDLFHTGLRFETVKDESILPKYLIENRNKFKYLFKD